ncbi:MAG: type II toxin-antitoxin system HicA family toxin [Campylobacterales bacterium]|nr:type II toxin-antitoxin system HicA family toxin [Campylobacterales bacterium]
MPEYPKIDAKEAEKILIKNGFSCERQKGSHKIYKNSGFTMVIPFYSGKILHPKIVKDIFELIEQIKSNQKE